MKLSIKALQSLALASFAALSVIPVQAVTLAGHLEQNYAAITRGANFVQSGQLNASLQDDCFPESYEGSWRCDTVVTDSAVQTVVPGQKVQCEVKFVKDASGKIVSVWNQDGWTDGQSTVKAFNAQEAQMDRTSFQNNQGSEGMWAARARGNFTQVNGAAIIAHSVVDQYIDGQYVGRYHTTSILRRENPLAGIADTGAEPRDFIDEPVNQFAAPSR